MGMTLNALYELQRIELGILELKAGLERRQRGINAQKTQARQLEIEQAAKQEESTKRQTEAGTMELELKAKEGEITKLRQQLNVVKTNKEYAAVLTQINTDKVDQTRLEESALQLMTQADEIKAELSELDRELGEVHEKIAQLEQQREQAAAEVDEPLKSLEAQRQIAAEQVSSVALVSFQRIAERMDGEALAKVHQINPKKNEYVCDGCNMSVTAEQVNIIMTRDDLQFCHVCGRILYLNEPAGQAIR
jgi:predicted  nucleic acid-binding Zn-ribbon protein